MKERNIIILLSIFFLFTGILVATSTIYSSDFNFNKAELTVNNLEIKEKLYYTPNQDYHTLYRNFASPIYVQNYYSENYIKIQNVKCTEGTAYVKDYNGKCYEFPWEEAVDCLLFTELNEYGCSFGNIEGFKTDNNYTIESAYTLNPVNLFLIKGKYYTKFIAYSKNQHIYLDSTNLIINSEVNENIVKDSEYYPRSDVIIYIPFNNKTENYNIIEQEDFEFDSAFSQHLIIILFSLLPLIFIILIWYFFGREKSYADVPSELSNPEKDRPGYEVAIAFNPPFSKNKNMFMAIMLELYNKKIIDFKKFEDGIYIKIIKTVTKDEILNKFLKVINKLKDSAAKGYFKEGYLNLNDAIEEYNDKVYNTYLTFSDAVDDLENKYLNKTGIFLLVFLTIILFISLGFLNYFVKDLPAYVYIIFVAHNLIFAVIIFILSIKTALFIQFKKEYYAEYLHWQSFKNYLKNSFAMRESQHEAVVLWGQYLVYAAAFGISKKLLKRLKDLKIIDDEVYTNYSTINTFAVSSFAFNPPQSSSGRGSGFSGGGFSGAGGGGIGGGGGGGR